MSERLPVVLLVDVDDTLLDNGHIQNDLREHLEREFGATCRDRYWRIFEALFEELGYRDYLGALQWYRIEHPTDIRSLRMSSYLVACTHLHSQGGGTGRCRATLPGGAPRNGG